MITFIECLESKKGIDKKANHFSNMLNSFPVEKSGLISDIYRKSPEYIEYKNQYNFWFKQLQQINLFINRNYKKENRKYLLEKRFKLHKHNSSTKNDYFKRLKTKK